MERGAPLTVTSAPTTSVAAARVPIPTKLPALPAAARRLRTATTRTPVTRAAPAKQTTERMERAALLTPTIARTTYAAAARVPIPTKRPVPPAATAQPRTATIPTLV